MLLILNHDLLLRWHLTSYWAAFVLFIDLFLWSCWEARLLRNLVQILAFLGHIDWIFQLVLLNYMPLIWLGLGMFWGILVSYRMSYFFFVWKKWFILRMTRFAVVIVLLNIVVASGFHLLLFNNMQFYMRCCFFRLWRFSIACLVPSFFLNS